MRDDEWWFYMLPRADAEIAPAGGRPGTSDHIGCAQSLAERTRDRGEQLIAGAVAERVVDVLGVVDVQAGRR
jgi:hypothetical protein